METLQQTETTQRLN